MIQIKGHNAKTDEDKYLLITEDGLILGIEDWNNIENGSVKRFTGKCDVEGNLLYEDDEIVSELNGMSMTIRYGTYQTMCPEDRCIMQNVGFYVEADGCQDMPLGPTEDYAKKVRNKGNYIESSKRKLHMREGIGLGKFVDEKKSDGELREKEICIVLRNEEAFEEMVKTLAASDKCPSDFSEKDNICYCDEEKCCQCWKEAMQGEMSRDPFRNNA